MAFTTMHMAVGMACTGALGLGACWSLKGGWRWIPLAMSAGALWAITPDLPRIFREDFPSLPLASIFGSKMLERSLHEWGDVFFFHRALDAQPHEYALHGLAIMLLLYNVAILGLMALERHQARRWSRRQAWDGRERRRISPAMAGGQAGEVTQFVDGHDIRTHQVRSSHLSRSA